MREEGMKMPSYTKPVRILWAGLNQKSMDTVQSAISQSQIDAFTTPEAIERLIKQAQKSIEMEADIKTFISVFAGVLKAIGLNDLNVSEGATDMKAVLPAVVGKLSREMMLGTFNTQALADIQAVMPIVEKYKHLASDEQ